MKKTKKDVTIVGFQVTKDRKEQLKKLSRIKGVSVSALLNIIISDYLESNTK